MDISNSDQPSSTASCQQIGAFCIRSQDDGPEILMITTRETKRWMIPKGWPIDGLAPHEVAAREAWEEAGVLGKVKRKLFGKFRYAKILSDGSQVEPLVAVYILKVRRRKKKFPEMTERDLAWMKPHDAARKVREPELRKLLMMVSRRFGASQERIPA
ncbi:NUDIX hydrolase [Rhizobium sp. LjRoot98]|uniref:NUDIX hydrolase n=1 Tax=unclassified Rhizobium TaxID=2613769 RepID=UPI000715CAEC|nr:NUDIX hydrolase [Rhizobium sp. Root1204]KQV36418.1 DNA mismatch repair protein MutT [Rhizobium sp. Root1204]